MIEVKRKERETVESLLRRFNRKIQQSRVLMKARKMGTRQEDKSKDQRREEAIYKIRIRKEIDRAKKMGRFDEETLREIKKRIT
jgi:ribosomal protein S21